MVVAGTENYTTTYVYDANNRLTQQNKKVGNTTNSTVYTYDANGNLVKKSTPNGAEQYDYNGFDQLTVLKQGSAAMTYAYNASGIRTAKRTENSDTYFLLDGGDVVAEYTDGELTASYLRGINLISSTTADGKSYYLHNAHGDVVALANSSGTVTKRYDYDAFGNEENPSSSDTNPFRYCGEYFDTETQTYYLRARYYAPTIGRFTQQDSVLYTTRKLASGYEYADPLSLNLYTYCTNNPVFYCDPTGHMGYEAMNELSKQYKNNLISPQDVSSLILGSTGGNFYLALHQIAQVNLSKCLYGATKEDAVLEYYLDGKLRADMVAGNRVWEVKPVGRSGRYQMRLYRKLGMLDAGEPLSGEGIPVFGDIKMRLVPSKSTPGVIHYELYRDDSEKGRVRVRNIEALKIWNTQLPVVLAGFGSVYIYITTPSGKLQVDEICDDLNRD